MIFKVESHRSRLEILLERAFETKSKTVCIRGMASLVGLAHFLTSSQSSLIHRMPHLVVVPTSSDLHRFQQAVEFFDPHCHVHFLSSFDVSPYSGMYPAYRLVQDRLRFLYQATHAKPGQIFIASIESLLQKTLPEDVFIDHLFQLKVGQEIPRDLKEKLNYLGYSAAPLVEDCGQYSWRGGVIDIFSPAESTPLRLELFGDQIESIRSFSASDQRSIAPAQQITILPAREVLFDETNYEQVIQEYRTKFSAHSNDDTLRSLVQKDYFPGIEFLLPLFYKNLSSPLDYLPSDLSVWIQDEPAALRSFDELWSQLNSDFKNSTSPFAPTAYYNKWDDFRISSSSRRVDFSNLSSEDVQKKYDLALDYKSSSVRDFSNLVTSTTFASSVWGETVAHKIKKWREEEYSIFVSVKNASFLQRLSMALEKYEVPHLVATSNDYLWQTWLDNKNYPVFLIPRSLPESLKIDEEKVIFLREEDFGGRREKSKSSSAAADFQKQAQRLSFGDLKPGDYVVHVKHGIGQYDGLKIMNIGGVDNEYIQIGYKDKDKLYLPVYRVAQLQKYGSQSTPVSVDKLGGPGWEKTKVKVRAHLRDIASELLALYAKRSEMKRPSFVFNEAELAEFERGFPYEETDDQLRAIEDIHKDFRSDRPMDRLICGDVGFGKTEVAMRAAFMALSQKKQVALLAPTTVLTFQHFETLKKRFKGWPFEIRVLNRFISPTEVKKTLLDLKEGRVDLIIGTHRLLSKDIAFKDLGFLIVDEEQKFGVIHKEKIKKLRVSIDTLALSATPIPRTLNMSLIGIRDLSLINTAPVDRLPTRTFITPFDENTLRKAIESEIHRGGQVYFIHNRIQSIYGVADELRQMLPQIRMRVAHGQMPENELEQSMLDFFNHEIDMLVCTAIVESGMDVARANTMFIDQAQLFGLSQLYQLRGRVGRSKERAYCYLILPRGKKIEKEAEERLKVIRENTALGSGIKIAQYDLELRGAGSLLGEEQSGHIQAVGYELYMDLLQEALSAAKGESPPEYDLDPEINLRIQALIPDAYISDIRLRLSFYKALSEIESESDLEKIEDELRDQFGPLPDPVINLMGLMLIRSQCKKLGVRDVSAGLKSVSLIFTEKTRLKTETVIQLAMRENKKYSITPDQRLNIRMNTITWAQVHEELKYLISLL